jgi:hypothetical protein
VRVLLDVETSYEKTEDIDLLIKCENGIGDTEIVSRGRAQMSNEDRVALASELMTRTFGSRVRRA